jgi:glutamate carboxypeptidase
MLASLASLVHHESPSKDKPALDLMARELMSRFEALGAETKLIANADAGDHLRVHVDGAPEGSQAPALVLCHFDTVWPTGTLANQPFHVESGRAYGPGIYDMKASLVLVESALDALRALGLRPPRPVLALFTSDEETGSATSRRWIEEEAKRSAYVLVMEPPLSDGRLKTARKGVGAFTVEVEGRPAHAGVEPEKGISAVLELAHQIVRLHALADPASGTTVNVGVIAGGTASNVVPAKAMARVDVRVTSQAEARRIEAAMRSLEPQIAGARVSTSGSVYRPPMQRTPQVASLYERVRRVGRSLGLDLGEGATGGASDGNFTAALGVPTLDGLGTQGDGAHAIYEHIIIDSLPERAALLACLLVEL